MSVVLDRIRRHEDAGRRVAGPALIHRQEDDEEPEVEVPDWPAPAADAAYHGVAGDLVRLVGPHTEADPHALLAQGLIAAGNAMGPAPRMEVDGARHGTTLFAGIVGASGKGRKGTSWNRIRGVLQVADPAWRERIASGLSSGEGLIWAVRDRIMKREPIRDHGEITGYQEIEEDAGVSDKRLMVVETELAKTLRTMAREGNSLSATIRDAFDHGDLRTLTKNSPAAATGAHISIIGHTTKDELLKYLDDSEAANGFANRFLWVCARRSKVLPYGGSIGTEDFAPIVARLADALAFASAAGAITHSPATQRIWHKVYPKLSAALPGLLGCVTNRAEALVLRLSSIYALLDCTTVVEPVHLNAALAVWDYCFASARFIFGESLEDPVAEAILRALRGAPDGLSRTEISKALSHHAQAKQIASALGTLAGLGLVEREKSPPASGSGRPVERWRITQEGR